VTLIILHNQRLNVYVVCDTACVYSRIVQPAPPTKIHQCHVLSVFGAIIYNPLLKAAPRSPLIEIKQNIFSIFYSSLWSMCQQLADISLLYHFIHTFTFFQSA